MSLSRRDIENAADAFAKSKFIRSMDKNYEDIERESKIILRKYFATNEALFAKHPILQEKYAMLGLEHTMIVVNSGACVFISFDVEAWEQNTNNVLEVGMSIYDPRNQKGAVIPTFKNIHIVVAEYANCHNGRYVPDRKNKFMGVDSIKMNLKDIACFIQGILEYYNKSTGLHIGLVGHSLEGDLDWLRSMGIVLPSSFFEIDTQKIFQYSRMKNQPTNLSSALLKLDIPHGYLHNAGNDAYFTLLLAFKLCDPKMRALYELDVWNPDEVWDTRKKRQREQETSNLTKMRDDMQAMNHIFG